MYDTFTGSFGISDSEIIILASIVEPSDSNGGEIIASFVKTSGLNGTDTLNEYYRMNNLSMSGLVT